MMVVAQVRLIPLYRAAAFTSGFWSFMFPWVAMGTLALRWLALEHPPGERAYAWVVIGLATALVSAIGVRTVVDIAGRSRAHSPASVTWNSTR
jgi:tellurite resistance protein